MTYITSDNIKTKLRYKDEGYLLVHTDDENEKSFFCGSCRTFSKISTSDDTCPFCGAKYPKSRIRTEYSSDYNPDNEERYTLRDVVNCVSINKAYADDGSLDSINGTVLCHNYHFDTDFNQKSYSHYMRITFHLKTLQVYYTNKKMRSRKVDFNHLDVINLRFNNLNEFHRLIKPIISEIYKYYGEKCPSMAHVKPSVAVGFYCLKFPAMMYYFMPNTNSTCQYKLIDIQMQMIYWACCFDSKLRKIMIDTSFDSYKNNVAYTMHKFTNYSDDDFDFVISNPLVIIYATYMHALGFKDIDSVYQIYEYISNRAIDFSIFAMDIIRKRNHTRNKFYKRLIKYNGEKHVVEQLILSNIKADYLHFYSCSSYPASVIDMQRFYENVDISFSQIDFYSPIDDIFNTYS